jgi:hypothetical protein
MGSVIFCVCKGLDSLQHDFFVVVNLSESGGIADDLCEDVYGAVCSWLAMSADETLPTSTSVLPFSSPSSSSQNGLFLLQVLYATQEYQNSQDRIVYMLAIS